MRQILQNKDVKNVRNRPSDEKNYSELLPSKHVSCKGTHLDKRLNPHKYLLKFLYCYCDSN